MADTGWKTAGTLNEDATGTAWTSTSSARVLDGSSATCLFTGVASSRTLSYENWGFSIPTGATIDGIEIKVTRRATRFTGSGNIQDERIQFDYDDGDDFFSSDDKANTGANWTLDGSLVDVNYGGSTDKWGLTSLELVPAFFNSSLFILYYRIKGVTSASTKTGFVDAIQAKVYYTTTSGDATATITGVSSTGSAGTLSATASSTTSLTGVSGTGSAGTVTASSGQTALITGVSATGSVGTLTATTDSSILLQGVSSTGNVGTLSPTIIHPLTGVSGTGSAGNITAIADSGQTVTLVGVQATGSVGTLSHTVTHNLTGVSSTGSAGTVTGSSSATTSITGVSATGSVGTLSPQITVPLTGVSSTGSAGNLSVQNIVLLSGVSSTGGVGTVTASGAGNATVTLVGVSGTGFAGTLTPSASSTVTLTGVSGTGSAGTVVASSSKTIGITGVSATGNVGTLTVGVITPLIGVTSTGAVGTLGANVVQSLVGVFGTGQVGVVTASALNITTVTLTGVSATGYVGTVTASGNFIPPTQSFDLSELMERLSLMPKVKTILVNKKELGILRQYPEQWQKLKNVCDRQIDDIPQAVAVFDPSDDYTTELGVNPVKDFFDSDADKTYRAGLCYQITGEIKYALFAQRFLDEWAFTLREINGNVAQGYINFKISEFIMAASWVRGVEGWDGKLFEHFLLERMEVLSLWYRENNVGGYGLLFNVCLASYLNDSVRLETASKAIQAHILNAIDANGVLTDEVTRNGGVGDSGLSYSNLAMLAYTTALEVLKKEGIDIYKTPAGVRLLKAYDVLCRWILNPLSFPYFTGTTISEMKNPWQVTYVHVLKKYYSTSETSAVVSNTSYQIGHAFLLDLIFGQRWNPTADIASLA